MPHTRTNTPESIVTRRIKNLEADLEQTANAYADTCDWLSRNLTDASNGAREDGRVGGNVMGSSLVQDITRLEEKHRNLRDEIARMIHLLDDMKF